MCLHLSNLRFITCAMTDAKVCFVLNFKALSW